MKSIILASGSVRRKEILEKWGVMFKVEVSNYVEDLAQHISPHELAKQMAQGKISEIAHTHKNAILIGADTIVLFEGEVFGKPHSKEKAKEMLTRLNGKIHTVITGFAILDTVTNRLVVDTEETQVVFNKVTEKEISDYVETGEPLDKAGAYAIQEKGYFLVAEIRGDRDNVVGFPMKKISGILREFGVQFSRH